MEWKQNGAGDWVFEIGSRDAYVTSYGTRDGTWKWEVCEGNRIIRSGTAPSAEAARAKTWKHLYGPNAAA